MVRSTSPTNAIHSSRVSSSRAREPQQREVAGGLRVRARQRAVAAHVGPRDRGAGGTGTDRQERRDLDAGDHQRAGHHHERGDHQVQDLEARRVRRVAARGAAVPLRADPGACPRCTPRCSAAGCVVEVAHRGRDLVARFDRRRERQLRRRRVEPVEEEPLGGLLRLIGRIERRRPHRVAPGDGLDRLCRRLAARTRSRPNACCGAAAGTTR